jgi:hypothetical protein
MVDLTLHFADSLSSSTSVTSMEQTYSSWLARWVPRPLAALGLLLATAGAASAQTPAATFDPVATYDTGGGSGPAAVAVADVNGDGNLDLLTANLSNDRIGVLLGTGTGTFGAVTQFSTSGSSAPLALAVADVNSDGNLDLLTANKGSNTAGVLLGTGTGTFGAVVQFSTGGNGPSDIAVADVNGDGSLDLLTANINSGTAGVLLGTGTGSFGAATTYSTGSYSSPIGIAVADVNSDGKPDLLIANQSNTAGVLLGTGAGAFGAVTTYSTGNNSFPSAIKVADVNGDGKLDLLTANTGAGAGTSTVGVLLGTGTGRFGAVVPYSIGSGSGPFGLAVADVNGDGNLDLLTANANISTVGVLLGTGTGSFGRTTTFGIGSNSYPKGITVADVNGDGRPDLLTANFYSNTAGVLLNTTVYVAPTLTNINPASAPVGTRVTVTGTNLTGATAVSFNGTAASSFVVNSATSLTAVVAAGTTTGPVRVTTPSGTATSADNFVVRVAPTTVADAYSTPQGVTLTGNVLSNDIGTAPRAILLNRPANGTLVLNPNGSFSYRPNAGFTGADSFTYYACDPAMPLLCGNPATVSITVLRIAPVTVADAYTTPQNVTLTGNVLANDLGTNPRAILITRPTRGTLVLNPDGTFTYQPNAGYVGADSFTYYACDPNMPLLCGNPATVSITVTRVAPTTVADFYATPQGVTLTGNVLTNDVGTNPVAILITRPTRGTLVLNPDGSFSYVPTAGFTGLDTFTYYACNMGSPLVCGDPATVTITVVPTNTATRTLTQPTTAAPAKPAATTATGATVRLELVLTGHPNPFSDELQLSFTLPIAQAYTLAVYDAQGRLVQQLASGQADAGQAQQLVVPTHTYAAGLYLVRLTTATGTQQLKLIKQ